MRAEYPLGASLTLDILEQDPYPRLSLLREHEPVSWVPAIGGWLVTGREEAIEAMRNAATYTVDDPRFSTAQVVGPSMLSLDGPEHVRHRTPFVDPFRQRAIRQNLEAKIKERATELVASLSARRRGDLRLELAAPLAVGVMTDALDLAGVDSDQLLGWYDDIVGAVDAITAGAEPPESGAMAFERLTQAVLNTMSDLDSLPGVLAGSSDLEVSEIVSNLSILLFGGIVTSEGTISTLLYQLLADEDQLQAVAEDRALVAGAVEEALRFEPAASVVDRYATTDAKLGEAAIGKGDLVRISLTAANRDGSVFPDPDEFDIHRGNSSQHLAFARGPHTCIGAHLARIEAAIALEAVLDGLPHISADLGASRGPRGLVFRGPGVVAATW